MTHVVTAACIRCKCMDCVKVCPVDAFREGKNMLVINPRECIDCRLCVPECPVDAIYLGEDVSPDQERYFGINAELTRRWPVISHRTPASGPRCSTRPICSTHEVQEMNPDSCGSRMALGSGLMLLSIRRGLIHECYGN